MTTHINEGLLPCPFCGHGSATVDVTQSEFNSWIGAVTCDACDRSVMTGYSTDSIEKANAEAADAWNARAPIPAIDLTPVIKWLEAGCDPKHAAAELRIYQARLAGTSESDAAHQAHCAGFFCERCEAAPSVQLLDGTTLRKSEHPGMFRSLSREANMCNHIYESRPIDGSTSANVPSKAVCKHCGHEPGAESQPVADHSVDANNMVQSDEQIRLFFFRDLNEAQRIEVFRQLGVDADVIEEITNSHNRQRRLLQATLSKISFGNKAREIISSALLATANVGKGKS